MDRFGVSAKQPQVLRSAGSSGVDWEGSLKGVVATSSGDVRGLLEESVWTFRGVPYGRCSGPLRWRAPEAHEPWQEVRDCFAWGPVAPQPPPTPELSLSDDPRDWDEECLTLNLWTPGLDAGGRPVLVWVHGGGFTTGTGASGIYRGDRMARRGDVVVVTFNYRLGALGFVAHRHLQDGQSPGCGNWGLEDQVLALEWVQENVGRFGGDPHNVTVFGESAGSMSIAALMATKACGRLFHKAVLQSGPAGYRRNRVGGETFGTIGGARGALRLLATSTRRTPN